ncbi:MFS transporter [Methylobacterium terricola]|uniref:MFS transporter n=1 Tax=Methylobacterium terricola TaxID=2583531 RepID=A0A5C4LCK9_9HYPH|nr:MFS transporter [Methylobacterium terricola]TNC11041.1 MFS transporter [Methylobacterium terricola]
MSTTRQFHLLTLHCAGAQAATSLAGGFVGAYLMKIGLGLSVALCVYAAILAARFALRLAVLPLVRRIGLRRALLLGIAVNALQFGPLALAEDPRWLAAWIGIVALSESLYWPILHAASAVTAAGETRGRQIAARQAATGSIAVVAPLLGGAILTQFGPAADFGLAAAILLLSAVPVVRMRAIEAGPVPAMRASFRDVDRRGMAVFAADGWMASGLALAWPMVLFTTLGSHYEAFAWSGSLAALAGVVAGLACGAAIDRGRRGTYLVMVAGALAAVFALRTGLSWLPAAAHLANAAGAAANGLYVPVIMSAIYERAKRSGAAYRFHLGAETGWDLGAIGGCLAGAAMASLTAAPSLAILPASLGIVAMVACVRDRPARGEGLALPDEVLAA